MAGVLNLRDVFQLVNDGLKDSLLPEQELIGKSL